MTIPAPGGGASAEQLGQDAVAAGAAATETDPQALLARIQQLEAQQRQQAAPEVVNYAQAAADHVDAKAAASPDIAANPDTSFAPGQAAAQDLMAAAKDAAAGAAGSGSVADAARKLVAWAEQHAAMIPALDYSYVKQLASEAVAAAERLTGG